MNLKEICQSLQSSLSKFGNDKYISGVLSINSRTYTIWIKCGLKKKEGLKSSNTFKMLESKEGSSQFMKIEAD